MTLIAEQLLLVVLSVGALATVAVAVTDLRRWWVVRRRATTTPTETEE